MIGTVHPNLQIWLPRENGYKFSQNLQLHYSSGQSNPPLYMVAVSNHRNIGAVSVQRRPRSTGRIAFATDSTYWQGDKIMAKEVANDNPHSLTMDTTLDGSFANLHGFTLEGIPAGATRYLLVKINGTGLTFADELIVFNLMYPSPA